MAVTLHAFRRPSGGWSNEERAQFLRIERLLADAGFTVEVEHGVTDEGDPWCVFCSCLTGDVMIHAARIGRRYVFDSTALGGPIEGVSFENCAERFFEQASLPMPNTKRQTLMLHPSAMLASLFLTVILYAQATSEQALLELSEEDAANPDRALALRLKQIAAQVGEFFSANEAQAQATAAANQGWVHAVPAGMAAAVIAIAHDLRLTEVFASDRATETIVVPTTDTHEALLAYALATEADEAPTLEAETLPAPDLTAADGDAEGAEEGEVLALPDTESATLLPDDITLAATAHAPDAPAVSLEMVPMAETPVPEDAASFAVPVAGGQPVDEGEATVSISAVSSAVLFFDGFLADLGATDGIDLLAGADVMTVAPAGEATGGEAAASAPAAADSYVVVIEPVPVSLIEPVAEPALKPKPAITVSRDDDGIETIFGASLADITSRVIEFITAAGDVEITNDDGDLLIVDEDVLSNPSAPGITTARFVFDDDSAITLIGLDGDVDLLLA